MPDDTETSNADCATCERAAMAVARRNSAVHFLSGSSLYKISRIMMAPSAVVPSSHVTSSHFQAIIEVHGSLDERG
jgi:hypothetical protein